MFTLLCLVIFTYYVKSVHKIIVSFSVEKYLYLSLRSAYIMQNCHKIVWRS